MSLFPDIDEEIEEIKKRKKMEFDEWVKKQEMFVPSNGTESLFFEGVCE